MQKQMSTLKTKADAAARAAREKDARVAELSHAAAAAQQAAQAADVEGPAITKLRADFGALKEELREARAAQRADCGAREAADRVANRAEGASEAVAAELRQAKVLRSLLHRNRAPGSLLCCVRD